jgi:hypothetical protein
MVLQLPFAVVREARVSAEAYLKFLESKRVVDPMTGIADPGELPSFMKPHQRDITQWALRRGRSASETCIWKDPVVAQQRTKSIRLLHKQITKDSTVSGNGLADYVVTFRKRGENPEPVAGHFDQFFGTGLDISREAYERQLRETWASAGEAWASGREAWSYEMWCSVLVWQRYASPVWMDIDQGRTLQYRGGRDEKDEVHISPLQLDVIERCLDLWSNPGDVVLTPFLGIGSEVYCAVEMGRKGIGFELKPSYFRQATKNLRDAADKEKSFGLFGSLDAAE